MVGHHVSVIGVQAAGARRVLDRDPAAASAALGAIEESSREAVTQMRSLLGTLRDIEAAADGEPADVHRTSGPGVADLPDLVEARSTRALATTYDVVADARGMRGGCRHRRPLAVPHRPGGAGNVIRHRTAAGPR